MKNVTVTLDGDVALWARIRAAEKEMSVSRLVGEMLKERMTGEGNYEASMAHYLSQSSGMIKKPGSPYPAREKLHKR